MILLGYKGNYMKRLLNTDELITHMKNKGIQFNIANEASTKHFLTEHNYYFKLSSYRKNYDKFLLGPHKGKYMNLDFAYLQDLSTIDFHIRYLIIYMCLDIEHSLRTLLLQDMASNPLEDGYKIVASWDSDLYHRNKIKDHLNTSYCQNLINKYYPDFPAWALLELLSFGELCKFTQHYDFTYKGRLPFKCRMLFPIRDIRNAAAHNNCLIHNVRENSGININPEIRKTVADIFNNKNARLRSTNLNNKPIHDFICLLYLYSKIVHSESLLKQRKEELESLIFRRIPRHKEYYLKNAGLCNAYKFVLQIFLNLRKSY